MSRLKGVVGASLSSHMKDLKVVGWLKKVYQGAVSAVSPVIILSDPNDKYSVFRIMDQPEVTSIAVYSFCGQK